MHSTAKYISEVEEITLQPNLCPEAQVWFDLITQFGIRIDTGKTGMDNP